MSKRQFRLLLFQSAEFLIFSASLFFFYVRDMQAWRANVQNRPVHERFIEDVKNGSRKLTTEDWIKDIDAEFNWAQSERELVRVNARMLRDFGWLSLGIAIACFWLVLSVRKDLGKHPVAN